MRLKCTKLPKPLLESLILALILASFCYILIDHVFIWCKLQSKFNASFGLALAVFPLAALLSGRFFKNFNRCLLLLMAVCFIFSLPLSGIFQTGASDGGRHGAGDAGVHGAGAGGRELGGQASGRVGVRGVSVRGIDG